METIFFEATTSERRALMLALGEFDLKEIPDAEDLVDLLLKTYRDDPDTGIHGAAEWLLQRWDQEAKLEKVNRTLPTFKERGDRRWFVNSEGYTMAIIDGPVVSFLGSPPTDPHRFPAETPNRVPIDRSYAIATKEVSVEQFRRFLQEVPSLEFKDQLPPGYQRDDREPRSTVTWYQAVLYCWWLSQKEGLEPCYGANSVKEHSEGMTIPLDFLKRSGYRLPTEAEWEYACRAGTVSSRYYGDSDELLPNYAWFSENSNLRSWPCGRLKPNDLGLFDMLGNIYEYCSNSIVFEEYNHLEFANSVIKVFDKDKHVIKGCAYPHLRMSLRSSVRYSQRTMDGYGGIGFRIVRTLPPSP
jgi:formylglycine-generating enzyme required for sulfatase activity